MLRSLDQLVSYHGRYPNNFLVVIAYKYLNSAFMSPAKNRPANFKHENCWICRLLPAPGDR